MRTRILVILLIGWLWPLAATAQQPVTVTGVGATNPVGVRLTDGTSFLALATEDRCITTPKIAIPINVTANTQLITGTASNRIYICSLLLNVHAAETVALVSGTGTVCNTSVGPLFGGTTAATGFSLAANAVLAAGNGAGWIAKTDTDAENVCLLKGGAIQVSGVLTYVVAVN